MKWMLTVLAGVALLSTALYLAHPLLRGEPMRQLAAWSARGAALAQIGAAVAWLGRRRAGPVGLPERVALLFATSAVWDLCGTLAPWADVVRDWGVLETGNTVFWGAICGVQVREIWRLR